MKKFINLSLSCLITCYPSSLWKKIEAAKLTSSTNNHQSKVQGQVTLILKTEKESKKKVSRNPKMVIQCLMSWKRYILFKKMMASSLRLMVFLKIKIRASIGCLMLMGNLVKNAANQLKVEDGDEIKFYQKNV